jgi:hypothetical protein
MRLFSLLIVTTLLATGCSVEKQKVRNAPPPIPNLAGAFKAEYGSIDQLSELSMFFWPTTKDGHPITVPEWQDVVAKANMLSEQLDALSEQMDSAGRSACQARRDMITQKCFRYEKNANADTPDMSLGDISDPCSLPWVESWKTNEELKDPAAQEALVVCQKIVTDGKAAEKSQETLATQKDDITGQIVAAIDIEKDKSNFLIGDATNSKLDIEPAGASAAPLRIKLAFSRPEIIYDSVPNDERGLIQNISYNSATLELRFTMLEKADGQNTGGRFDVSASRVGVQNRPNVVRFSGTVIYSGPKGERRFGRLKIDGSF